MAEFVVAIDGPAGSGKSSVAKEVARTLGFGYLDTGAGYRAYALWLNQTGQSGFSGAAPYSISTDPDAPWIRLADRDVAQTIRTPEVAAMVSAVAQDQQVRNLQKQDARTRIEACPKTGVVVEGRDITTVVAPDAQVRILLTASEKVRLQRRGLEQTESADNLVKRDQLDSKVAEFQNAADGVVVIDTTDLDFAQSVAAVIREIERVRNDR